jgi:hypothetical protein
MLVSRKAAKERKDAKKFSHATTPRRNDEIDSLVIPLVSKFVAPWRRCVSISLRPLRFLAALREIR